VQHITSINFEDDLLAINDEGYLIKTQAINNKKATIITAKTDVGLLYGTFAFLRLLQTNQPINDLNIISSPKIQHRLLNHWDNLDRMAERGYAGFSIWDWHRLPEYISTQYIDYARANASIGINGTVLNNVNAQPEILTNDYLIKVATLADAFRPYGVKVYVSIKFSSPTLIGGLKTSDPLQDEVIDWWKNKVEEIYTLIPDFGGFLVKANSEGQPGPQNYGRTHADGANMLADALEPYGGIVMWRAFVYDFKVKEDRAKQAYMEFTPFDKKFKKNVLIQVKNGPIDFQPREPFHPLFGAMEETSVMMEFQITQEYLGQGTHLVYLAPMYKECLYSDTYAKGEGSLVSSVIDGSLFNYQTTGIAGVSNIGTDRNWTGHHFGQSNWYCFGKLAWNHNLTSEAIADEWIKMTFTNDNEFVTIVKNIMLNSRETTVNYMTPLGLHHQMAWDHHYGPGPWVNIGRPDWTSLYYHNADTTGIGFNRTKRGSDAVSQYFEPLRSELNDISKIPEKYLLWFHHADWDHKLKSGNTVWDELCYKYYAGADSVKSMLNKWNALEGKIDTDRFNHIQIFLNIQYKEALWWRNACVLYFQTFSKREIPEGLEKPDKTLDYYMNIQHPYAPGI
ncbi:alpha-glucuronidase family glycosyl hydrolase, partial [Bacteroidota bacterium]